MLTCFSGGSMSGKGSIEELKNNSEVIIITGKRGSGKTCLACYLLEKSDNAYFFGFPEEKKEYHPEIWTFLRESILGSESARNRL